MNNPFVWHGVEHEIQIGYNDDRYFGWFDLLAAAPTPVISGGLKTVIVTAIRREIARFSDCRHQASGMWSLAL